MSVDDGNASGNTVRKSMLMNRYEAARIVGTLACTQSSFANTTDPIQGAVSQLLANSTNLLIRRQNECINVDAMPIRSSVHEALQQQLSKLSETSEAPAIHKKCVVERSNQYETAKLSKKMETDPKQNPKQNPKKNGPSRKRKADHSYDNKCVCINICNEDVKQVMIDLEQAMKNKCDTCPCMLLKRRAAKIKLSELTAGTFLAMLRVPPPKSEMHNNRNWTHEEFSVADAAFQVSLKDSYKIDQKPKRPDQMQNDNCGRQIKLKPCPNNKPYDYQIQAAKAILERIFNSNENMRQGYVVLPCGTGKTLAYLLALMASGTTCLMMRRNNGSLLPIIEDILRLFAIYPDLKPRIGAFIGKNERDKLDKSRIMTEDDKWDVDILLVSATEVNKMFEAAIYSNLEAERVPAIKKMNALACKWPVILVDEAHEIAAQNEIDRAILTLWARQHAVFIGMTQSMARKDDQGDNLYYLKGAVEKVIYKRHYYQVGRVPLTISRMIVEWDMSKNDEEYLERKIKHAKNENQTIGKIIEVLANGVNPAKIFATFKVIGRARAAGRSVLVFFDDIPVLMVYAKLMGYKFGPKKGNLIEEFKGNDNLAVITGESGITAETFVSMMKKQTKDIKWGSKKDGLPPIILTSTILETGWDIPWLSVVVFPNLGKDSEQIVGQRIGRVVRAVDGFKHKTAIAVMISNEKFKGEKSERLRFTHIQGDTKQEITKAVTENMIANQFMETAAKSYNSCEHTVIDRRYCKTCGIKCHVCGQAFERFETNNTIDGKARQEYSNETNIIIRKGHPICHGCAAKLMPMTNAPHNEKRVQCIYSLKAQEDNNLHKGPLGANQLCPDKTNEVEDHEDAKKLLEYVRGAEYVQHMEISETKKGIVWGLRQLIENTRAGDEIPEYTWPYAFGKKYDAEDVEWVFREAYRVTDEWIKKLTERRAETGKDPLSGIVKDLINNRNRKIENKSG